MKRISDEGLRMIEEIVRQHPEGVAVGFIAQAFEAELPRRTL